MSNKFNVGTVVEAGDNWFARKDSRHLSIIFRQYADNSGKQITPGTRFVIEDVIGGGHHSGRLGDVCSPDEAFLSQLNDDGTYNPDAEKMRVDVSGEWRSCGTLDTEKTKIVGQMKRVFV